MTLTDIVPYARKILAYMPTYAPDAKEEDQCGRLPIRLTMEQIAKRINDLGPKSRNRPALYMDCIDSVVNQRPDIELVVADAKSSDIIRTGLAQHHKDTQGYQLAFYPEKLSQWAVLNDILARHAMPETEFFIYTSSDVIWAMDWVAEAIKEFDKDPALQIIFPMVNAGDLSMPLQLSPGPQDKDLLDPADFMNSKGIEAARAPCCNAYAFIVRMEFFRVYGGYQTIWKNCFSESFLYYQCQAMGGKMRVMPRGWCYHHNGGDVWVSEKGFYGYTAEKPTFDRVMDDVQRARTENRMTADYLKSVLYV